jgi:hypothetical protein
MFSLTVEAAELLVALHAVEAPSPDAVLRLQRDETGFGLEFDRPRETDMVVAYNGRILLVIDGALAAGLGDCALAIHRTAAGPELALMDAGPDGSPPGV